MIASEDPGCDSDGDIELRTEEVLSLEEQKISNVSTLLRGRLIRYSEEGHYPLCEFLDFENVRNYVTWLLNYA